MTRLSQYDFNKPIIETLVDESLKRAGLLPDHIFAQVCTEYGIDEEKVMDEMISSKEYKFDRYTDYWDVSLVD